MLQFMVIAGIILINGKTGNSASCSEPDQLENGYVTCPEGTSHFSMCVTKCNPGYVVSGPSRQMCWCRGPACSWKGTGAICKPADCDMPFYDEARLILADKWPTGFAGIADFTNVPSDTKIKFGWSIVIVFDKPLGKNATITSWNTEMSAASYDGQTFTIVNLRHNEDLSKQLTDEGGFQVLFIVQNVVGAVMPSSAYVGLYDSRISDASCVLAPKMPAIQLIQQMKTQDVTDSEIIDSKPDKNEYITTTSTTTTTTKPTTKPVTTKDRTTKKTRKPRYRYRRPPVKPAVPKTKPQTTPSSTTPLPTATTVFTKATTLPPQGRYCILQRNPEAYVSEKAWTDRGEHSFNANLKVLSPDFLEEWSIVLVFSAAVKSIQVWSCEVIDSSSDGLIWTLGPLAWDSGLKKGDTNINFLATTREVISGSPTGQIFLCSDTFTSGDALMMRPKNDKESHSRAKRQAPKNPGDKNRCAKTAKNGDPVMLAPQTPLNFKPNNDWTKYNYNELLHKSILFFEAQRSGKLPKNQRVPWRGDSALKDGCDAKVDASGGWYDAGNFVKYHFPMAFSLTTLAWGGIEFRDAYEDAGELQNLIESIKWSTRYFIKAHVSRYELIGQVGNSETDDSNWGRPEEMAMKRPTYKITREKPGTELAAETAAALAASSIFLIKTDPTLSASALRHAKELYEFADKFREKYHVSIPAAAGSYKSYSGYTDELVWSAAWLYGATFDNKYLKDAGKIYDSINGQYAVEDRYAWDRKLVGAQALLALLTGNDKYRIPLAKYLDQLATAPTTPKGMYFLDEWGPNRYTCGAIFMTMIAGKLAPHLPRENAYLRWAEEQMGMILGDTGKSYVIGFGKNYPKKTKHRASSCPPAPQTCDWSNYGLSTDNHYILYGAMVGGPDKDGNFTDDRENIKGNHVACDYNAVFQSSIAGLKHFAMKKRGTTPGKSSPTKTSKQGSAATKKPKTPKTTAYSYGKTKASSTAKPQISAAPSKSKPTLTSIPRKTRPPISEKDRCSRSSPVGLPVKNAKQTKLNFKPNNDGTKHNYNEVLHMCILFFEAQQAGRLSPNHRVTWRGDSTLKDGCEIGVDLSGGWFDAGDHVKFGFPMAFSLTTLAWGGIAFRKAYEDAGELENMIATVRHGAEWFINAHTAKYELVGQVGNGKADHEDWGRPETMSMRRPVYKITAKKPGTELAAEAAAALAASSIFLKQTDPEFAKEALRHANELYEFADKYRGTYHKSIPDAKEFYASVSGYDDELIWGAAWLYKATNDAKYLKLAASNYNRIKGKYVVETRYSWDRKLCGAQALLAELTGGSDYKNPFFAFIDNLPKAQKTPQGLFFITKWGSNRYAAGAAFMASIAAKMNPAKKNTYQNWAKKQIGLMLGDGANSFVVGYGKKYPKRPHHRSSSCPPYPKRCDWAVFNSPNPNYYILYGALVGGPDAKGKYLDKRPLYEQTEVTTDYNACFQSAVAGVKYFAMNSRGSTKPKPPKTTVKPYRPKPKPSKPPTTKKPYKKPAKKPQPPKGKKPQPPKGKKPPTKPKKPGMGAKKKPGMGAQKKPGRGSKKKPWEKNKCKPVSSYKCKQKAKKLAEQRKRRQQAKGYPPP